MNITKKTVSILLSICMVFSVISISIDAHATDWESPLFSNSDKAARGDEYYYTADLTEDSHVYRQSILHDHQTEFLCDTWEESEEITGFAVEQILFFKGILYASVDNLILACDADCAHNEVFLSAPKNIIRFAMTEKALYYLSGETLYEYDLQTKENKEIAVKAPVLHFWLEDADTLSYMKDEVLIYELDLRSGGITTKKNNASSLGDPIVKTSDNRNATLTTLRNKFPAGKYWNHAGNPGADNSVNNQDGYTSSGCTVHGVVGTNQQTCNGFQPGDTQLSWQCMGYAEKCGYDVSGFNPRNNKNGWNTYTSSSALSNLKAGDIVRYQPGSNLHSIYVIGVSGDTVTYTDCNSDGHCIIRWDRTVSKSTLASSFVHLRSAPSSPSDTDHAPVIMLDVARSPSAGKLYVAGWAYDPDSPSSALNIHVYLDGFDYCISGEVYTGGYRPDVPAAGIPCGSYQGFGTELCTSVSGSHVVNVYAINIGEGPGFTAAQSTPTVTIAADTAAPTISQINVTDLTTSSYKVSVSAYDNVQIREVKMPSWAYPAGGDSANWIVASNTGNSIYTATINQTGKHRYTDPYAYDIAGNSSVNNIRIGVHTDELSFNANGGSCTTNKKTVFAVNIATEGVASAGSYTNAYGALPTPTRTNYNFDGWYTAASGGSKVTANTIVTSTENHTLYAHWTHICEQGHSYSYAVSTAPTFNSTGIITGTCSRCGETTSVSLPKLNTVDYSYVVTLAETCTTDGAASYTWNNTAYGTIRIDVVIPATGHSYTDIVTPPTCLETGYTTHTCSVCGDSYIDTESAALGHAFGSWSQSSPPNCTEFGLIVRTCLRCGMEEHIEIDPLGHLPGEAVEENRVEPTATTDGGFDTVIYCQRCGEELDRTHTVLPATGPAEPIEIDTIRIFPSISIGIEVLASFSVRSTDLSSYESWYIEVSKLDGEGNPTETKRFGAGQEGSVSGSFVYKADYRDITAKELGVPFTASVHAFDANGQEYVSHNIVSNSPVFTVRDYILGELVNEDNADATRKLAADLLNYGAAAQVYFGFDTENLVNENLSTEAQAAMNTFATAGEAPAVLVNNANSANIFTSVSVMNRIMLTLSIRGFSDAGAVQIEIKNHESGAVKEIVDAEKLGTIWRARYSGFEAEDMRTAFDFTVLADGVASGTPITWSVEGYAREARLNEDSTTEELALLNALLHYVDAVAAVDFGN